RARPRRGRGPHRGPHPRRPRRAAGQRPPPQPRARPPVRAGARLPGQVSCVRDLISFRPGPGTPDGTIAKLLMAHESCIRAQELRAHLTLVLALLGVPLAVAAAAPAWLPRYLGGAMIARAFALVLALLIAALVREVVSCRRRARLISRVDPSRAP